jgi:glycosyltransferase involved in cell wall biosynthesis
MTDTAPSVSVVIPCFNDPGYLHACLESLITQTFTNWEAAVVDDGSTEGDASDIVQRLDDERVTFLRHDANRGVAAARNTGIRATSGAFVFAFDSDDELTPHCLESLASELVARPSLDAVFPDFWYFGTEDGVARFRVEDIAALLRHQWIPGPGSMFRRTLWERVGGYCEDRALAPGNEDWDFWLAAAGVGLEVGHVPSPLYRYRRHPESLSRRLLRSDYATRRFLYERHRELFDRHRAGNPFLAQGYRRSAVNAWRRRARVRALRLSLIAFWLAPVEFVRDGARALRGARPQRATSER